MNPFIKAFGKSTVLFGHEQNFEQKAVAPQIFGSIRK